MTDIGDIIMGGMVGSFILIFIAVITYVVIPSDGIAIVLGTGVFIFFGLIPAALIYIWRMK